jgi:exodeoxyribonuclease V alpha subunit
VKQYYQPIESCADVSDAFALLSQFRVLCATRQGDCGVENINEVIKGYLGKNNVPFQQNQQTLYHGQPIMINENDYRLGLYNGDIGIIWRVVDQKGKTHLMACFEDSLAENEKAQSKDIESEAAKQVIRQILPSRLPKFESVYAMTIHKTQGSEFSHVAMVLSATQTATQSGQQEKQQSGSKLLSRELLYTGITRAKKQLTIAANQRIWQQGVTAQVQRHSGLNLCLKLS